MLRSRPRVVLGADHDIWFLDIRLNADICKFVWRWQWRRWHLLRHSESADDSVKSSFWRWRYLWRPIDTWDFRKLSGIWVLNHCHCRISATGTRRNTGQRRHIIQPGRQWLRSIYRRRSTFWIRYDHHGYYARKRSCTDSNVSL